MLELLFLLLPVAAGYGWVMGRNSVRQQQRNTSKILTKQYFKGLNFLLSDQPDKAVDTLIKMVDINTGNVETHIAMGNFFRHRGEIDRAIKVHQNLVNKKEVAGTQRENAMYELGRDYLLAGFLERAENAFLSLMDSKDYYLLAHQQLFNIYQTTKEWDRAIELAENMVENHGDSDDLSKRIAHFYCEQAQIAIHKEAYQQAEKWLQRAVMSDEHSVRPWFLLAEIEKKQNNFAQAFDYLSQIPHRDVDWVSEAIPGLWQCAEQTGNWSALKTILESHSNQCATAYLALVSLSQKETSSSAAAQLLLEKINKSPSMKGFHKLLSLYASEEAENSDTQNSLMLLNKLIEKQIEQRPKYRCNGCGFSGKKIHWLCPSCKTWGEMKPIKGLDGE
ncbi:lipopolysaccharide assembly protein LapB [Planctobacterium marinum]|uniref:lipopolysaccharide assembly protein LapB n=1 Tax=Planctobacterium marinum TaxID=1631968 RepID=UPI001E2F9BB0|nr:lipopolysaccharide assembly protein LapB [Planctobacterium marinum]MCC2604142.1 lipopolysaccharide assembly protein LapB [Planctobacterium marinum]